MIKTRSSQHKLLYYDPEIERTLRRIRKEQRKIQVDLEFNLEKLFEECLNWLIMNLRLDEGWRDHPNLRYEPKPPFPQTTNPRPYVQQNFQPAPSNSSSLEGMVKNLAIQIGQVHNQGVQYQQKTDTHLQNINTQIGQICTSLSNLENTKHESTILLGRPFLKTSKALIDVAKGSVVLESNGEKIELNMIDKDLILEANATDYVANSLKQI
ncbi:hypothetical protein RDABS01_004872, partial [Bienertia sinuspersici]